jgi:hypothetical protein
VEKPSVMARPRFAIPGPLSLAAGAAWRAREPAAGTWCRTRPSALYRVIYATAGHDHVDVRVRVDTLELDDCRGCLYIVFPVSENLNSRGVTAAGVATLVI